MPIVSKYSKRKHDFKEDLLHYVWKFQKFDQSNLRTTEGEKIIVQKPGYHNHNAGPDFLEAVVKIGDKVWMGSVEIHIKSKDWILHKHQHDKAYNNVILHVVFEHDKEIRYSNSVPIPTLELNKRIQDPLIQKYKELMLNEEWIACAKQFHKIDNLTLISTLDKMLISRIEQKSMRLEGLFQKLNSDWDALTYATIARYFGLNVNAAGFERLIDCTGFEVILKNKHDLFKIEALLFGQSGLLENTKDEYPRKLKNEYDFLSKKYRLQRMQPYEWKFSRMRPSNFPGLRIAQLAKLIFQNQRCFSKIIETDAAVEMKKFFKIELNGYWNTHYRFDKESHLKVKKIGESTIDLLMINVIAPLLFFYGMRTNKYEIKEKAIGILRQIPKERNKVIRSWEKLGVRSMHAADTQALIYMKKEYCDQFKCLECPIGSRIVSS